MKRLLDVTYPGEPSGDYMVICDAYLEYFRYVMGNRFITTFANVLFNSHISDLETCFELMPLTLHRQLDIRSAGFG